MRRTLLCLVVLAACGGDKGAMNGGAKPSTPITRTTTAAALDSLPAAPVAEGRLLCLADGKNSCPTTAAATANWLQGGQFAVWEPHRPIQLWSPDKPDPQLLGEVGPGESQYDFVLSVAATRTGFIVLSGTGVHALRYDGRGTYLSSVPFPPGGVSHATGYSGSIPFYQVIRDTGPDSAAEFEVREIDGPGDTVGRTVFKTRLEWLRLRAGKPAVALPLFPILPSYAIAADSDVVWSPGGVFTVERRSPSGEVRWSLTSSATGPDVTPDEIRNARARLTDDPGKAAQLRFDSSVANTPRTHPAVGAIYIAADGRVLVAGVPVASSETTRYVVLSNTGQPTRQFRLPRVTRVLLFAGDSLVVQRPGANAQPELRWLVVVSR